MSKFTKTTVIVFFIIFIGIAPILNTNAKTLAGTIYSQLGDEPIIDGFLNETAWDTCIPQEFTLYSHTNISDTLQIEVVSILSEYNHIYFGISIYDDNFVGSELFVIFFKVNESTADLVQFYNPLTPFLQNGNDAKGMYLGSNSTFDCFTQYSNFDAYFDQNVGGDTNAEAKSHIESSELVTMEMDMLRSTSDVNGTFDADIDIGDEIEIFFWYLDNTGYYSGYLFNTTDYEYGILSVGGSPSGGVGFTTTALILGVFSVNLIVVLIAKKKKK